MRLRRPLRSRILVASACNIGGQAVIEGVMMRSPRGYAVAIRKADDSMRVKKDELSFLSERSKFFKLPILRGVITLFSSLYLGVKTLSYSADEYAADLEAEEAAKMKETAKDDPKTAAKLAKLEERMAKSGGGISNLETVLTLGFSFALAIGLFVVLPHGLTWLLGEKGPVGFSETSLTFHAIDGVIKAMILVLYLWGISWMKDIQRVFEYHGAEHKTIYAFEKGEALTLDNVRRQSRLHPRCGTSFIFFVLMLSIIVFSIVFPLWLPLESWGRLPRNLLYIVTKIALTFPIAGIAYECIRQSAKRPDHPLVRLAIAPGLLLQRITTREPDDAQLEVAIRATVETLSYETDLELPAHA